MAAEIESIARAWMEHQGYTWEQVLLAEQQTCQNSGCELEGYNWNCHDDNGNSNHPESDALYEACDMARVAIEALESIGYVFGWTLKTRKQLDDLHQQAVVQDNVGEVWQKLRAGHMNPDRNVWHKPGDGQSYFVTKIELPAKLLDDGL